LDDAPSALTANQHPRLERPEQVGAAVPPAPATPGAVVRTVYADVEPALWPAAELSVRAQLEYLRL
ncbi:MAG: MBL fold metallo-hydrolase, partial [Rhodoferax sp.]|nr:MBL fold metallo-hydrolase [Actinomycetota bacterium]